MGRRAAGLAFIGIAAFLYGLRYLCAVILLSTSNSVSSELFHFALKSVGKAPIVLSVFALIIGLIYLFAAEFGNPFKGTFEQIRKHWREFQAEQSKVIVWDDEGDSGADKNR